jgi:hypothetical protein
VSECEIPSFYRADERKARRDYKCCECSATILAGEKYLYCCGQWDGEFNSYYQHLLCAEACMYIRDHLTDGDCIGFGELKEFWSEDKRMRSDPKHEDVRPLRNILAQILRRSRREDTCQSA